MAASDDLPSDLGDAVADFVGLFSKDHPDADLPDDVRVADILSKPSAIWTESERDSIMNHPAYYRPDDSRYADLAPRARQGVQDWYDHTYGDGPAAFDETGRMRPAVAVNAIAQEPQPGPTVEARRSSKASLGRWIGKMAGLAAQIAAPGLNASGGASGLNRSGLHGSGPDYIGDGVRLLQTALNGIEIDPVGRGGSRKPLLVDGDYGPKTQGALDTALAYHGDGPVREAVAKTALRQLGQEAEAAPPARLAQRAESILGGLAGAAPNRSAPNRSSPNPSSDDRSFGDARSFQNHLNRVGGAALSGWEPLVEDGELGPKTAEAMHRLARRVGGDALIDGWTSRWPAREGAEKQPAGQDDPYNPDQRKNRKPTPYLGTGYA